MVTLPSRTAVIFLVTASVLLGVTACQNTDLPEPSTRTIEEIDQETWRLQESLTHDCMEAEGFEYIERPYPGSSRVLLPGTPFDLSIEQAKESGFGYVDQVLSDFENGDTGLTDPNDSLQEELDDPTRDAYHTVLFGVVDSEIPGCRTTASESALKKFAPAFRAASSQQIDRTRVLEDRRYVQIMDDWMTCMRDAGYSVVSLEEFHREYNSLAGTLEIVEHDEQGEPTAHIDESRVARVRQDEIDAAVASTQCLAPHRAVFEEILEDSRS